MREEELEHVEQAQLAALNASLRCEQHQCHPQTCGCPFDPITIEEAREVWGEEEPGEDAEVPGLDHYISIIFAVERQHKLHIYQLRSQQLVREEMTDD